MPAYYENRYIAPTENLMLSENIMAKEFMCNHCSRIKMSYALINKLTQMRKEYPLRFYTVKGYLCPEWCIEKGKNPNKSHALGTSADVHFGKKANVLDALDYAAKLFPYVGLIKESYGDYSLHLQVADDLLYWLCLKKENEPSAYVYYKDYAKLRKHIESHPEIYAEVKI